jgi:uncharacterized protein (TIGR03437 family)
MAPGPVAQALLRSAWALVSTRCPARRNECRRRKQQRLCWIVLLFVVGTAGAQTHPVLTAGFPALLDDGSATPPDTTGAVGPQHIMTTLNSEIQIQTRSGAVLSRVALEEFWKTAGPIREFATDPHVLYDRAADRWVMCVLADPDLTTSALLIGASKTGDPTGAWSLYRINVDPAGALSGDYPLLGFNDNWVVATVNMYRRSTFSRSQIYVFSKAEFYSASSATPHFTMFTDANDTWLPVLDFDHVSNRLFLVEEYAGVDGKLAVSEIQGEVGNEKFLPERGFVEAQSTWAEESQVRNGNFAPQLGTGARIDTGDARMQSCVLRSAVIWCAHTVFLPANIPTRSAVQWIAFDPNSYQVRQFGRIDDPTAVNFYAYPSIAVNKNNDVLIGFNRFSVEQFPSADFVFRAGTDPMNAMGPDTVIKAGEGLYVSTKSSGNRWGDFSGTVLDPLDDLTFWTIQEYGAGASGDGVPRWATWWAAITPENSITPAPVFAVADVRNAASFKAGPLAPGEIITILGSNLGPAALVASGSGFGPLLAGTRVLFDGLPAPLIYASAKQTAAVVPFSLAGKSSTQIRVEYLGILSSAVTVSLAQAAPAVFTADQSGTGQGAIQNQNASVNSAANPAAAGSVISIYGTGAGQTSPGGVDGQLAASPLPALVLPVTVQIGGVAAEVQYAGPAPALINGVVQVNARIPMGVRGNAPVIVTIGGVSSPAVTVAVSP